MPQHSPQTPKWQRGLQRSKPRLPRARTLALSMLSTAAAATLAMSTVGGTYAWLNVSTTAPGATLRAGNFELLINGAASASLDVATVSPASPVALAFSIANTGDAPAILSAVATTTSNAQLLNYATARLSEVTDQASCVAGSPAPDAPLTGFATAAKFSTLAIGETKWFCLELGITPNPPEAVNGQNLDFLLTITGDQDGS